MEAESRGHRIAFTVDGQGPPVVLVPGLLMSGRRWHECGYVAALSDRATVIAVDPLGHGESSRPSDPAEYSFPAVADDLVAVLDRLGIGSAAWWGYSRGGMLAGCVAIEHPERVTCLIGGGTTLYLGRPFMDARALELAPLLRKGWDAFWPEFPLPPETQQVMERVNDRAAIAAVLEGGTGYGGDAARISCPTFLYAGSEDLAAAVLDEEAKLIGAAKHVFPGLDHAGGFQTSTAVLPVATPHLHLD